MTGTRKHVIEHVDDYGARYRVEFQAGDSLDDPDGGEVVGTLWTLIEGLWRQMGYPGDPVSALAEHEWHGDKFEDYFTREGDR